MTAGLPPCRHRGRELSDERWICRSPKLVVPGRIVSAGYCRGQCPFVDDPATGAYPDAESCPVPLPAADPRPVSLVPELVSVGVITAPRAVPVLRDTLHELRRAGFAGEIRVFAEPGSAIVPMPGVSVAYNSTRLGLWGNWESAARRMLEQTTSPFLLLCEDDLWLSRGAALGLQAAIDTLPHDSWGYASLYTPLHNLASAVPVMGWQPVHHPSANWGALAYCFPRQSLQALLNSGPVRQHASAIDTDMVVTSALRELGLHRYFHVPSLCAHAGGRNSSVGHVAIDGHRAYGFHHDECRYRAAEAPLRREERLRVGMVTIGLGLGGVEAWLVNLARGLESPTVHVSGIAFVGDYQNYRPTVEEILSTTRLFIRRDQLVEQELNSHPGVVACESAWHALKRLADESDVLIVWGVSQLNDLMTTLDFPGRVVIVAQGECDWTASFLQGSSGRLHEPVAVSNAAAARFPRRDVTVIPNGVDERRCRQTLSRSVVRSEWGIAANERVLGFFGRFSPEKNPLAAARAAAALGKGHRAVLIGCGSCEAEVRRQAPQLSPGAVVVAPRTDPGNVLRAFDVFVLASDFEGLSLAMIEAWMCGVPVVSTPVGGVPELERRFGQLVFLVPHRFTDADLAAAVRAALADQARPVIDRARRIAGEHFTAKVICRQWTRFLTEARPESSTA